MWWSLSLVLIVLTGQFAYAGPFPWIEGQTRLHTLEDPSVDMALRVHLIRHAKHSVRIAVYQQVADAEVGIPLLRALREAAQRGVEIQFLTSSLPAFIFDWHNMVAKMLTDKRLKKRPQILLFGGLDNRKQGWNLSDMMHEKILIVDDEVAIIGGRNQGIQYLNWLDFDAVIQGGPILEQIRRAYADLFYDVSKITKPLPPRDVEIVRDMPNPAKSLDITLSADQRVQLGDLVEWLKENPEIENRDTASAFRPSRSRVISHRFLNLLSTGRYNGDARIFIPDAVVAELVKLIATGREIRISTMFALLHPNVKDALIAALARGASVYVHLNGDSAARETIPLGLSYSDSLQDLLDLLKVKQADGSPAKMHISIFQQTNFRFLHKKMFIIDDHVFFGSHNFNLPSSISNSEICVETQDLHFAQMMSLIYDRDFVFSGRPLSPTEASADFEGSGISRWIAKFFHNFF